MIFDMTNAVTCDLLAEAGGALLRDRVVAVRYPANSTRPNTEPKQRMMVISLVQEISTIVVSVDTGSSAFIDSTVGRINKFTLVKLGLLLDEAALATDIVSEALQQSNGNMQPTLLEHMNATERS
jgi:hypothetical protein